MGDARRRIPPRERLERGVVRALDLLPAPVLRRIAGDPVRIDGQELELEVQLALALREKAGRRSYEELGVDGARRGIVEEARTAGGVPLAMADVRDVRVPGPAGAIPARLYVPPDAADASGLLVFFHGGGWTIGDVESHDAPCRLLAHAADVRVLSVDYRLAPEDPFPAAVDDCLAAFRWAAEHAAQLGADPERIAVGGDSAGGNLAAVICQLAVGEGGPVPCFQLLVYPATDSASSSRSRELFQEGFLLTRRQMDWYQEQYLRHPMDAMDPRASPLRAESLAGLPPAYITVAGFDPLRDEGEAYAAKLREAGVPVALRRHRGLVHGFFNAIGVGRTGRDAVIEAAGALRVGMAVGAARGQRATAG